MTDDQEPGALRATLLGTGSQQEANPTRQAASQDRLEDRHQYHVRANTHLWMVVLSHYASDQFLDAQDGVEAVGLGVLDLDTMAGTPGIACYVCEAAYEPRLRFRRCPGDPNPIVVRHAKGGAL